MSLVYITRAIIYTNHLSRGSMGERPTECTIRLLLEWATIWISESMGGGMSTGLGAVVLASIYLGAILSLEGQIQVKTSAHLTVRSPWEDGELLVLDWERSWSVSCRFQALIQFTYPEPFLNHISHHYTYNSRHRISRTTLTNEGLVSAVTCLVSPLEPGDLKRNSQNWGYLFFIGELKSVLRCDHA